MIDFEEYLKNKMKDKNWKKGFDKEYKKIEEKDDLKDLLKEIQEMPIEQLTKDEFLEHLFRLAKLDEFNSFDAKNVK